MENLTALSYELRKDVINMIRSGKAGHIGGDMSVIDTLVTLYFKQMNIGPENMDDPDRDRFVMSKGQDVYKRQVPRQTTPIMKPTGSGTGWEQNVW